MTDLSMIAARQGGILNELMNPQNEHAKQLRFMQASNATEIEAKNNNTLPWLMFIGLVFAVWQILYCFYRKNEAYRARKE